VETQMHVTLGDLLQILVVVLVLVAGGLRLERRITKLETKVETLWKSALETLVANPGKEK